MPSSLLVILFFCLVPNCGVFAGVGPEIGTVNKVESPAQVGAEIAIVGTPVHMNDELRTGPKGRLQVTFRDGTTLTHRQGRGCSRKTDCCAGFSSHCVGRSAQHTF